MKKSTRNLIIILAVIAFIILLSVRYVVKTYDKAVAYEEQVKAEWGNVQSAYQRRADLIQNLVNTVKGVRDFEQETLVQVIEARAKATSIINILLFTFIPFHKFRYRSQARILSSRYPRGGCFNNRRDLIYPVNQPAGLLETEAL